MNLARLHREALCDTALATDPDGPTLCPPWRVRDLLAHLHVRDTRPDAMPGVRFEVFARHTDELIREAAEQDYADLVGRVRSGPPVWSPVRLPAVDDRVNLFEMIVHHEDIRRAGADRTPLALTADVEARTEKAIWSALPLIARLAHRRRPMGIVLVAPGVGRSAVRRPGADRGSVVLTGTPLELLLHTFGRTAVAAVEVTGDDAEVVAFATPEH